MRQVESPRKVCQTVLDLYEDVVVTEKCRAPDNVALRFIMHSFVTMGTNVHKAMAMADSVHQYVEIRQCNVIVYQCLTKCATVSTVHEKTSA